MNDEQLKPCPFCGNAAETPHKKECYFNVSMKIYNVIREIDRTKVINSSFERAWNTRPGEAALLAEVERLKAALETIANDCKARVDTDGRLLDASPIKFPNRSLIGYYARRVLERAE